MIKYIQKPIILFLFLNSFNIILNGRCGADKLKLKPLGLDVPMEEKKRRLHSSYSPIKIYSDYSNLRTSDTISSETLSKI